MNDQDFITDAASLLACCSPSQLNTLAGMVQTYVSRSNGAEDRFVRSQGGSPPMSLDEMLRADPDYGKSVEERFPNIDRLRG